MFAAAGSRALAAAGRLSAPSRRRLALTEFFLGSSAPLDRAVSAAYFAVAAPLWAREQDGSDRLEPLRAGFDAVPGEPDSIIELGCGAGRSAVEAAGRWPRSSVRAYDSSVTMIRSARTLGGPANVSFARRSARHVVDRADLVLLCNYLPHPDIVRGLLVPAGHVLVVSSFEGLNGAAGHQWQARGFTEVVSRGVGAGSYAVYAAT